MKSINLLGATLLASTALLGAGNVFANDLTPDPASASTPVEVTLSPRDLTGEVPTPPTSNPGDPNNPGGGDDSSETLTGPFGIAYAPAKLVQKEETVELGKSANQMVNLKSSKGDTVVNLNVGVRDETAKTGRNWTLSAQLHWTASPLAGASIEAQGAGNVTENISGTLSGTDKITNDVTDSLSIGTGSPTNIMTAKNDKVMSGTYNYQFKMPQLKIADPTVVAAGTYTGNIVWNLSNVM